MIICRRLLHGSVYDKNIDDHVCPVVVPDELIQPQSDKYWAPNPNTGVFGPDAEQNAAARAMGRGFYMSPADGGAESVLEQKAFFRPLEDLEKPQHPWYPNDDEAALVNQYDYIMNCCIFLS